MGMVAADELNALDKNIEKAKLFQHLKTLDTNRYA